MQTCIRISNIWFNDPKGHRALSKIYICCHINIEVSNPSCRSVLTLEVKQLNFIQHEKPLQILLYLWHVIPPLHGPPHSGCWHCVNKILYWIRVSVHQFHKPYSCGFWRKFKKTNKKNVCRLPLKTLNSCWTPIWLLGYCVNKLESALDEGACISI